MAESAYQPAERSGEANSGRLEGSMRCLDDPSSSASSGSACRRLESVIKRRVSDAVYRQLVIDSQEQAR